MSAGIPDRLRRLDRPAVFGVLNVTPDSFSDGGRFASAQAAIDAGVLMHAQGADVIDVGGESTRPGAIRIDTDAELKRVVPVVVGLVSHGVPVSIDTMRARTAAAAIEAGACIINDVSGGQADPQMYAVAAQTGAGMILMHWRAHSEAMESFATYTDLIAEVIDELQSCVDGACAAGISRQQLIVDPGLGFAKLAVHNWELLRHLDRLSALELPVMIGASRKRFLGELLSDDSGALRPASLRDGATSVITAHCARAAVWAVRVHDVPQTMDALLVASALQSEVGK